MARAPIPIALAVVSDDPKLRDSLAALLRDHGFRVRTFSRAEFSRAEIPADGLDAAIVADASASARRGRTGRFHGADLLTAREIEVLAQIADGASNEEAARALGISRRTVESHRARILEKLGARNTAALIRIVLGGAGKP